MRGLAGRGWLAGSSEPWLAGSGVGRGAWWWAGVWEGCGGGLAGSAALHGAVVGCVTAFPHLDSITQITGTPPPHSVPRPRANALGLRGRRGSDTGNRRGADTFTA